MTTPAELPLCPGPGDMPLDSRLPASTIYPRPEGESVDYAGNVDERLRAAAEAVDRKPSKAQTVAGNRKLGHVYIQGLDITIEVPLGAYRTGVDKRGKHWSMKARSHYGYIRRTESADGECVDCFVGPHPKSEIVFVVDQVNPESARFDEHKCMIGYTDAKSARSAYLENYPITWGGLGELTPLSMRAFKKWLLHGDTRRRIRQQVRADYQRDGKDVVSYADVVIHTGEMPRKGPTNPQNAGAFAPAGQGLEHPGLAKTPGGAAGIEPAGFMKQPHMAKPEGEGEGAAPPAAPPAPRQSLPSLLAQSNPQQIASLLTHEHDWSQAQPGDHAAVAQHLSSMEPTDLLHVAHFVAQSAEAPHGEQARKAVTHALIHAPAGPSHPVTPETKPYAHFVLAADPQQQAHVDAVLGAFPKVEGTFGGVYLPHGLDLQALLGEQTPVQVTPLAVAERQRAGAQQTPQSVEQLQLPPQQQPVEEPSLAPPAPA